MAESTKISSNYEISNGEFEILASITAEGEVSLFTDKHSKQFIFEGSDSDVIEDMASCLLKVHRLAQEAAKESETKDDL